MGARGSSTLTSCLAFTAPAAIGSGTCARPSPSTAAPRIAGMSLAIRGPETLTSNIFGLVDFAVAVTLGMVTTAGRFQLIVANLPSVNAGTYPDVLTPAFVVPGSILLHALSLRQHLTP